MNLKPLASNMTEVEIGNKLVLFSYKTPVAYLDGENVYVTDKFWSRTTSRHITKWFDSMGLRKGDEDAKVSQDSLDNLLNEVK